MSYREQLTLMFMKQLVKSPRGRAHLLAQVADAENNDEGRVFRALKERSGDAELMRLVNRHAADEERHAELLTARCLATGVTELPQVPDSLKLLRRLDTALGGFFAQPLESREDVMKAYLLLQVIEERAMTQFPIFRQALTEVDPESARVFEQIEADEARHLKYCHAIARRFAPSAEVHARTLEHFRAVEARVFAQNTNANMFHTLDLGLLEVAAPVRWAWRALGLVLGRLPISQPTPYAGEPVAPEVAAELLAA